MFAVVIAVPAVLYGCWAVSGWLLESGYLPGARETATQAVGAALVFLALFMLVSLINWFLIDSPREKAKEEFWKNRGKAGRADPRTHRP